MDFPVLFLDKGGAMARSARATLPSDFIHVTTRGLGRRIIFEDDLDKERFLSILSTKLTDSESRVYAWCLMDNHIHLLLRANSADLSKSMQRIGVSYAQYFNGRHGHVGKVFQNRFNAHPIMGETHLLATIRYIHRNPLETGTAMDRYDWSSYRAILGKEHARGAEMTDSKTVLELFGGKNAFIRFHNEKSEADGFERIDGYRRRIDDVEAAEIAIGMFGSAFSDRICSMPKAKRDDALARLKFAGLSIRQIERLTGIGRGIITRARACH